MSNDPRARLAASLRNLIPVGETVISLAKETLDGESVLISVVELKLSEYKELLEPGRELDYDALNALTGLSAELDKRMTELNRLIWEKLKPSALH